PLLPSLPRLPPSSPPFPYTTLFRSCPVAGPGLHPVGHQAAGVAFQQGGGVGVVPVHHAQIAPLEQLALPAAVFLKGGVLAGPDVDRKSTRLNSSHVSISYAVFCLKK